MATRAVKAALAAAATPAPQVPDLPGALPPTIFDMVQKAVASALLPPTKKFILVAGVDIKDGGGASAVIAQNVGTHWQIQEYVEWHADTGAAAGAQVVASW